MSLSHDVDRMTTKQTRLPLHVRITNGVARLIAPTLERIWRHRLERTSSYLAETSVLLLDVRDALDSILHAPSDKVRNSKLNKDGHRLIREIDKLTNRIIRETSQEQALINDAGEQP